MRGSTGAMVIGLLLALGMAGLLLAFIAMDSGASGIIALLLMIGVVVGLIVVVIGAVAAREGR